MNSKQENGVKVKGNSRSPSTKRQPANNQELTPEWIGRSSSSESQRIRKKQQKQRRSRSKSRNRRKCDSKVNKDNKQHQQSKDQHGPNKPIRATQVNKYDRLVKLEEEKTLLQIEEENKKLDEQVLMEDDDEETDLQRKRQERELLYKKYEFMDAEEILNQQPIEEDVDLPPEQKIDNNIANYFRMLDHERNMELAEEEPQDKLDKAQIKQNKENRMALDMFDMDEGSDNEVDIKQGEHIAYEGDDESKYYRIIIGETIKDYRITSKCGKGVFGNVCKAMKDDQEFAIKFIRAEEIYLRSGEREKQILKQLNESDKNNKKHILRLIETFVHKKHICLVFESMEMNLREAVKLYGQGSGLGIDALRSYSMQLFVALSHLRKNKIIHADIKPDNILISKDTKLLKLCDFGTAFTIDEATMVEYLVSRFYRSPEIIIGYPYDTSVDMWSAGCTLFELYTGEFLFPGNSNNEMVSLQIQTMGKLSMKMLKRAALTGKYFDQHFNFLSQETDPITKMVMTKPLLLGDKPTRNLLQLLKIQDTQLSQDDQKLVLQFKDLLEKCLQLNPKNRITPEEALLHPFIKKSQTKGQQ